MRAPAAEAALDLTMLLANAVHDAKNALGMMLGSLDQLDRGCDRVGCGRGAELEGIRHEGRRVNAALVRLLVLYRMQEGGYRPAPAVHEVDECLESCGLEHGPAFAARGLALAVDAGAPLEWPFDRDLVESVLHGALNNAYKHARARARLSASEAAGSLVLRIEDDGPGFPAQMLVPGAAAGVDRARDGTGLGLYFAARVAAAHASGDRRGRVELGNDGPGGGARFSLYLP